MVDPVGPPAMNSYEPRQARKGATVVGTLCAGVWLARSATQSLNPTHLIFLAFHLIVHFWRLLVSIVAVNESAAY